MRPHRVMKSLIRKLASASLAELRPCLGSERAAVPLRAQEPGCHPESVAHTRLRIRYSNYRQLVVSLVNTARLRGCSLVVKPQSSKLMMRVRFPSSPPKNPRFAGGFVGLRTSFADGLPAVPQSQAALRNEVRHCWRPALLLFVANHHYQPDDQQHHSPCRAEIRQNVDGKPDVTFQVVRVRGSKYRQKDEECAQGDVQRTAPPRSLNHAHKIARFSPFR